MLALRELSKRRERSLGSWLTRGSLSGGLLGFTGTFVVETVAMRVQPDVASFALGQIGQLALGLAAVGTVTGAVIGSLVGTYCWKVAAEHAH